MRAIIAIAVLLTACKGPVRQHVRVEAHADYHRATSSAMGIINGFVGCNFMIDNGSEVPQITLKPEGGQACGTLMRIEPEEWGHAATAYQCGPMVEILVAMPGHLNTQACIAAHELGHGLGLSHSRVGIMSPCKDPNSGEQNYLRVRDKDVKALRARYCR